MGRGACFHSAFIQNNKSRSLQMACQQIKGKKKSSNKAQHHAAVTHAFLPQTLLWTRIKTREVADCPSWPHLQLVGSKIGLVDWMEQAKKMLLRDKEEQASPDDGHDSLRSKMLHEASATLDGVNDQKQDDEGLFAGKKTDRQSLGLVVQCRTWCCSIVGGSFVQTTARRSKNHRAVNDFRRRLSKRQTT
jgi:hypothetical protein